MPKMKTHKGTKKRYKITGTGKVRHRSCNTGHLMSGKSGKRRRNLRGPCFLKNKMAETIRRALGVEALRPNAIRHARELEKNASTSDHPE